jgi:acetyltransferase-like isoleucine patch superfamily enzyme
VVEGGRVSPSLVHPTAILYPNVKLGDGATVEPYVVLGSVTGVPLEIGANAIIRSGTRIYGGVRIGDGLRTGHNALIRGDVEIGDGFHVGSYSSVEGTVRIGDRVKIQGRCEIADSFIHDEARLWVQTIVCDNNRPPDGEKEPPVIGRGAHLYARVLVMPGATIGAEAVIAANAMVKGDVPDGYLLTRSGRLIEGVAR